jgi:ketosteroid isomerase-like protein
MYAWLIGLVVRRGFRKLNGGKVSGALDSFAPDARFVFPGRHSFAADTSDPEQIRAWFERFVALGPHFEIADVIASGPPWNLRVGVRFSDRIALPDGAGDYRNEGMQYVRLRWGRVRLDRIFLDTQAVAEADPLLARADEGGADRQAGSRGDQKRFG